MTETIQQENYMFLHIIRKTEVTGCAFEDGGDTRKTKTEIFVVPDTKLEEFNEASADDYGYQDYSYQVAYKEIAKIGYWEVEDLIDKLKGWVK